METVLVPKRRLQFSLRTLMLAVLIYGALWLLTIKWGANQIAENLKGCIHVDHPGSAQWTPKGDGCFSYDDPAVRVDFAAYSPFPFVIASRTDVFPKGDGATSLPPLSNRTVYLWFFGASKIMSDDSDRPRKK